MKLKTNKIIMSLLVSGILISMGISTLITANEIETTVEETPVVNNGGITPYATPTIKEQFPDGNMAIAIADYFGKSVDDTLTGAEISGVTTLSLQNKNIKSIEGISAFYNVQDLYLNYNQISDLSPINGMPNLWLIDIQQNNVSDLSVLSTLPKLKVARLGSNPIENIDFVKSTPLLEELLLFYTNVTDISALGSAASSNLTHINIDQVSSASNEITWADNLTVTNIIVGMDGLPLAPTSISDGGTYDSGTNTITYTNVDYTKASLSYSFQTPLPSSNFAGKVIIPIDTTSIINAKNSVDALLNDTKSDIYDTTTEEMINDARQLVNVLPDGQTKTDLLADVNLAKKYLDDRNNAKVNVDSLFDQDGLIIKDSTNQTDITDAEKIVKALPDSDFKTGLQDKVNEAQKQLNDRNDAINKVEDLFTDNTHTNITDTVDQKEINEAQDAINKLPPSDLKDELQKEIDKAQDMLDAENAVDDLFNDKKDNLADGVTQDDIDKAQDLVNKLPDGTLKDELQKEIDKAQDMLDAKNAANDLLDKDGNLNSGVTQKDIDKVQDLVNKLPDGELKDELQAIIDEAQKQLDEQSNPSVEPPVQKPSVNPSTSSTTGGNSVTTGDETKVSLYLGMLVSAAGLVILTKRRKEAKQ